MLLQTFVQLNILLLTAPALAGWAAPPPCHPLLAQMASAASPLTAEPTEERQSHAQAATRAAATRPLIIANQRPSFGAVPVLPSSEDAPLSLMRPFPLAARAP